ncbi:MAG: hypothetical protein ABSC16_12810 [Candidatus Dormibacteria bacterium]
MSILSTVEQAAQIAACVTTAAWMAARAWRIAKYPPKRKSAS